ncbi:hypothetical protein POM88_010691 [Heracleum sosnowskyi]|uniref:RING-type E3 ubiquitin transferase n=1 Tax=Heracleum sosnowskyi TaxID=360622 RepID=A0AAD8MVY5_9APIA|nr:hypothetical protein POM88_010691 [Heracleum sosnowskyi]
MRKPSLSLTSFLVIIPSSFKIHCTFRSVLSLPTRANEGLSRTSFIRNDQAIVHISLCPCLSLSLSQEKDDDFLDSSTSSPLIFKTRIKTKHHSSQHSHNCRGNIDPYTARKNSGIDPNVIDLVPIFRFSSLKGQIDELECAVCLTNCEALEVIRLLPKCQHTFHVECADTWLKSHSTCPLCRYRVDQEDILLIEHNTRCGSTRSISSIGCLEKARKDELLLAGKENKLERRIEHRIVVSSDTNQQRLSDVQPSNMLYIRSQMLMTDSQRVLALGSLGEE